MSGNDFLDKLALVDPEYIEAAEAFPAVKRNGWVKWGAMAACFCLVIAASLASPHLSSEPSPEPVPNGTAEGAEEPDYPLPDTIPSEDSDVPRDIGTVIFNESTAVLNAVRRYIPGYFTEELSAEELDAVEPDRKSPDMTFSGYAGFDGDGTLIDVCLNVEAPFLTGAVTVYFSYDGPFRCYELSDEPKVSTINGVDFTVYKYTDQDSICWLEAYGNMGECSVQISHKVAADLLGEAKEDFAVILDCFSSYGDSRPNLSAIAPANIPEFKDESISLAEAQADLDFGAFMISDLPKGFESESIRRYKDQNSDYLSGMWTKGYDELRWTVRKYSESDESRITSVEDTENYDLSLYPIPRASSVPAEKWEIVNDPIFNAEELTSDAVYKRAYKASDSGDTDNFRMSFSVKYGDIIVKVTAKGVSPEWVWSQLEGMK